MKDIGQLVLAVLGPAWLPVYWIWQLFVGLVGVCYYLVVERTQNVLFPARTNTRSAVKMRWFWVPLLLIGLIPALVIQLAVALVQFLIWWHRLLGSWQTGFTGPVSSVLAGVLTEAVLILVFIGSFYHPLPWRLAGVEYAKMSEHWYRSEGTDPIRILLTGPVLLGVFGLILVPFILAWFWPGMRKIAFLPAMAACIFALYDTLRSTDSLINIRWLRVSISLFILVILLGMMSLAWRTLHRSTALRQFVWFFAIRLLEKKRIALFSLAAVTLCTAMLLIIVSVMGGFAETVREKSHGLMGDIILEGDRARGFPYYEGFLKALKEPPLNKIVLNATPVIYTGGLLRVQKPHNPNAFWTNPVRIQGIDLKGKIAVSRFGNGLYKYKENPKSVSIDHPIKPPDRPQAESLYGMIYGLDIEGFAYRDADGEYHRHLPDYWPATVSVIPLTMSGKIANATTPAITRKFYMVDDSRTGVYDIDANSVYVDFNVLQNLLYMDKQEMADGKFSPPRTHQIHVKLKPGVPLDIKALNTIKVAWIDYTTSYDDPLLEDVEVNTWEDYNTMFIQAVENEKKLMITLFGIISIVAVFLILAIFYMIVVEKTRDIGILKSIGASASQIAAIFLAYGGVIGFIGSIMGTVLGYYFVKHINEIQNWLIRVFGWRVWNREIYAFDEIPNRVSSTDIIIIILAAIVASIIGALIPAVRAAKMNPVESLRYE